MHAQKGAALLIMLVVLVLGALYFLLGQSNSAALAIDRDRDTADALARAKDALIGYAARGDDGSAISPHRPGTFPCPSTHHPSDPLNPANDPSYGTADLSCSDGDVGLLPWRTLGIAQAVDASGAPLWYTVSGSFTGNAAILNNDSNGTLVVIGPDQTTRLTQPGDEAVAIVFSAGGPLGTEVRASGADQANPINYLERIDTNAYGLIDNAGGTKIACTGNNQGTPKSPCPIFIAGATSAKFNDRLLIISRSDFVRTIEARAVHEAEAALNWFYGRCGYYPSPANFSNPACIPLPGYSTVNCIPDSSVDQGRIPFYATTAGKQDWYGFPAWFLANRWDRALYYAVAPDFALGGHPNISAGNATTCKNHCLTVDNDHSVRRLLIAPGNPLGASNPRPSTTLSDYLETPENLDGDDVFATPVAPPPSNDQLFKAPRPGVSDTSTTYNPQNPGPGCDGYVGSGGGGAN